MIVNRVFSTIRPLGGARQPACYPEALSVSGGRCGFGTSGTAGTFHGTEGRQRQKGSSVPNTKIPQAAVFSAAWSRLPKGGPEVFIPETEGIRRRHRASERKTGFN